MIPFRLVKSAEALSVPSPSTALESNCGVEEAQDTCIRCGETAIPHEKYCRNCEGMKGNVGKKSQAPAKSPKGADKVASYLPMMKTVAKSAVGGAAVVGGLGVAAKIGGPMRTAAINQHNQEIAQMVAEGRLPESELIKLQHFQQLEKFARSGGNPILNLRLALKRARKSSSKYLSGMVSGSK